jgi:stage V sporulation protein AB
MLIKTLSKVFLVIFSASYGLISAAGVFTILIAVGLVPRFAGKTHTADKVVLYEEMMIAGTIMGCIISVFNEECRNFAEMLKATLYDSNEMLQPVLKTAGITILVMFGLFSGMFVGCLALAIAEMLDSIPIFARRVGFKKGIGIVVLSMAAGKFLASILYFALKLYENLE